MVFQGQFTRTGIENFQPLYTETCENDSQREPGKGKTRAVGRWSSWPGLWRLKWLPCCSRKMGVILYWMLFWLFAANTSACPNEVSA